MTTLVSPLEIVSSTFNFGVQKHRLVGPDNVKTPHFGLFRDDTFECVGNSVSEKYTPHTTDDVLALVEAAGHAFEGEFNVRCHWNEGHHVIIEPTRDHRIAVYDASDNIFPRFGISAGYDGKAFNAFLGMYRDACRNLARMQTLADCNESIRHTKNLRPRMKDLIKIFQSLKSSWGIVKKVVAKMEDTKVCLSMFLEEVYKKENPTESARGKTVTKNRNDQIFNRVRDERRRTGRPELGDSSIVSAWEAYNAVQGYVQHESNRRSSQDNEFDRILLAARSTDVKRAEEIALELSA